MNKLVIEKVKNYIANQELIDEDDKVLVGLSGGVDSVALLIIMKCIYEDSPVSIHPLYVHHKMRPSADLDVIFCTHLCKDFGYELKVAYVDVPKKVSVEKISEEDAARILRYDAFEQYLKEFGGSKIAVAHHMEDQAETVLHRLIRGSGGLGLSGMTPQNGKIIRPLLECSKNELIKVVEDADTGFIQDETNEDLKYTRNKIRHELLPLLKENYNENIVENLNKLSKLMQIDESFMLEEAELAFQSVLIADTKKRVMLDVEGLRGLNEALLHRVLRLGVRNVKGDLKNVEYNHIKRIIGLIEGQSGKEVPVTGEIAVKKEYSRLLITRGKTSKKTDKEYPVFLDTMPITGYIQNANITFSVKTISIDKYKGLTKYKDSFKNPDYVYTKWFDYDKIETNLVFRTRQPGDRIVINENGDSKLLKKYFTDEKIPGSLRDDIPLLVMNNQVLWIVGYRVSNGYPIVHGTKTVLEVRLTKEDKNGKN